MNIKKIVFISFFVFLAGCSNGQTNTVKNDARFEKIEETLTIEEASNSFTYKLQDKITKKCYLWVTIHRKAVMLETEC